MRWTWLIPRLVLVAVLWMGIALGLDPWLRWCAVGGLQSVTGARVDIAELDTDLFSAALSLRGVALADAQSPGRNLVEFDQLQCRLDPSAMMQRSVVIESARLTGVRFGGVRNDDGRLEPAEDTSDGESSWLKDQLKASGSAWLDQLTEGLTQQLDPNSLETWRTGQTLSAKWDQRMDAVKHDIDALVPKTKQLQQRMEEARKLDSARQVQEYVRLAQEGEQLLREARILQQQLQELIPEAQQDLAHLDTARRNDQQRIVQQVHALKPSPRRIAESVLGPTVYRNLHATLEWLRTGARYQRALKQQTEVVRHRGQDIEFLTVAAMPGLVLRRAELSGEVSIQQRLTPIQGVLTNVTSDPRLLGQPAVLQLQGAGDIPFRLAVRYDGAGESPRTDLAGEFVQQDLQTVHIGDADRARLMLGLSDAQWRAQLTLQDEQVQGQLQLVARCSGSELHADRMPVAVRSALAGVFSEGQLDAAIHVGGSVTRPELQIESQFGEQAAERLGASLANAAQQLQQQLAGQIAQVAEEQKQQVVADINTRYRDLSTRYTAALQSVQQTQKLLAGAGGLGAGAGGLFRQVSESGLLRGIQPQQQPSRSAPSRTEQSLKQLGDSLFR